MNSPWPDKPDYEVYESPAEALAATDDFFLAQGGFERPEEVVLGWVREHVEVPETGRVLDLCCGDGIWSKAIKTVAPAVECFGIDLSAGGIARARALLQIEEDDHFVVGDAEASLPFPDDFFDLIWARGPGLYNQHDMDRPGAIAVIEMWHRKLAPTGRFYSVFASDPRLMGTYTPIDQAKLPFNRSPRRTKAVDFQGGKYHHSVQSFLTPFWKATGVEIESYSFLNTLHVLVTRSPPGSPDA